MLSFPFGAANGERRERENDRALVWMPTIEVNGKSLSYLPDASGGPPGATRNEMRDANYTFTPGATDLAWLQMGSAGSANENLNCTDCAGLNFTFTLNSAIVPSLTFANFPFDEQELTIQFSFGADTNVSTCGYGLLHDPRSFLAGILIPRAGWGTSFRRVLPTTDEYKPADTEPMRVGHVRGDVSMCEVTLRVRRDGSIVFIKVVLPTILIVYLGLMVVLLSAKEHSGDRAAILGVSILICMINLERDHGLGKLMYSTWFDIFFIFQLGIQVLALIEGLVEHRLLCRGKEAEVLMLNKVWTLLMLFAIYPIGTLGILLYGYNRMRMTGVIYALLFGVLPILLFFFVFWFHRELEIGEQNRQRLTKELREVDQTTERFMAVFCEAFKAFDLDSSGSLDPDEVREMFKATFGKDKVVFATAMKYARKMANGGTLSISACEDIFDQLEINGHLSNNAVSRLSRRLSFKPATWKSKKIAWAGKMPAMPNVSRLRKKKVAVEVS